MHASHKLLHVTRIPIRWGDMDALSHVNNTVYFRYMEQTRVEWFEAAGLPLLASGETAVIINASCTFLVPLTHPGTVEVRMLCGAPGRSSFETYYELRLAGDDRICAHGSAKVVWMSPSTGKSAPLPDRLRALVA
jgi:acyl-CoA thioester hydrolase